VIKDSVKKPYEMKPYPELP